MKKYLHLLVQTQRTFQFSSKVQISKLLVGNILVGICEVTGFVPLLFLVSMMANPASITTMPVLSHFFNYFSISSPQLILIILSLFVAVFFLGKSALQIFYYQRVSRISAVWGNVISQKIFLNYFEADYSLLLSRSLIKMRTTIGHGNSITDAFLIPLVLLFSYLLQAIFLFLVLMWTVKSAVILILILGGMIVFLNGYYLRNRLSEIQQRLVKRLVDKSFIEEKAIANIKEAKLSGKEDAFIRQYNSLIRPDAYDRSSITFLQNLPSQFLEMAAIIVMILSFNLLTLLIHDNQTLVTKVGIIIAVVFRLLPQFNKIIASWNQVKSFAEVLDDTLKEYKIVASYRSVPTSHQQPIDFQQTIVCKNINYCYPNGPKDVLHDINITIRKGQFIGITGTSGSGKSTLLNILVGFLFPKRGGLMVDGKTLRPHHSQAWHKKIGLVDQNFFIANGSIAENVAYGEQDNHIKSSPEKKQAVINALKKAQLWDFIKTMPLGIYTMVGEGQGGLSGGQRQRLAIARAFYRDIELLVLDEASANLDIETEKKFFEYLATLRGQLTLVMVAHRLSTLKNCDQIFLMQHGRISNSGTFAELEDKDPLFRLYLAQSRV